MRLVRKWRCSLASDDNACADEIARVQSRGRSIAGSSRETTEMREIKGKVHGWRMSVVRCEQIVAC